jgi:hypothetical protein
MRIVELFESGKRLASQGIEVSRVTEQDFLTAKAKLKPLLDKAGLESGWTAGGAGSFDPEHPYGGGGREDSGDIDIMIDPTNLLQRFPPNVEAFNAASKKPLGPKAMANTMADPDKKARLELSASKWALATYMTKNGLPTDPGTLTVEYTAGGKSHSVDLIVRPKSAWELHAHDFATDPEMRGGDLWVNMYPVLAKLASQKTFIDPKTGEEKGNLQYSPDRGLVDRDTNQVIAINKNDIAKILLGPNATARDMSSMTGIRKALAQQPDKLSKLPAQQGQ